MGINSKRICLYCWFTRSYIFHSGQHILTWSHVCTCLNQASSNCKYFCVSAHAYLFWETEWRLSCKVYFLFSRTGLAFTFSQYIQIKILKNVFLIKIWLFQIVTLAEGADGPGCPCTASLRLPLVGCGPRPHLSCPVPVMSQQGQFPAHHSLAMPCHGPYKAGPTCGLMSQPSLSPLLPQEGDWCLGLGLSWLLLGLPCSLPRTGGQSCLPDPAPLPQGKPLHP